MIEENKDCWLIKECNCIDCDSFCMRRYKLNYLYEEALITLKQRFRIPLRLDKDESDKESFTFLSAVERNILKFVEMGDNIYMHSTNTGCGKAQPDDALIFTSDGYVKMKDILAGTKIYGEDGRLHSVVKKFDRGIKNVYKVSFQDGTSTLCCDEHLWTVYDRYKKEEKTVELNYLINSGIKFWKNKRYRYGIPITKPLHLEDDKTVNDFYIHPYILGCLLGDGCLRNTVDITNVDYDILKNIEDNLPETIYLSKSSSKNKNNITYKFVDSTCSFSSKPGSNKFKNEIRRLSLFNTNSYTKFIPDEYKYGSIEVRQELLRGLLDTDGYCHKSSRNVVLSTSSKQLSEDVKFIVQSLGGTCRITEKRPKYIYKGLKKEGHINYRVWCKFNKEFVPFKCSRKAEHYLNKKQQLNPYRTITAIDFVEKMHCYCIMTDNKTGLYLTNDLIVTHNTSWALRLMQAYFNSIWIDTELKCRGLFIHVPRYLLALKDNISEKSDYVQHIKENVLTADLVIWDEIGTKEFTQFEHENILNLINARIDAGKSNIYTSNLSTEELRDAVGDRLYSRIILCSNDVPFVGLDKRAI